MIEENMLVEDIENFENNSYIGFMPMADSHNSPGTSPE